MGSFQKVSFTDKIVILFSFKGHCSWGMIFEKQPVLLFSAEKNMSVIG